jgi:hypothetical protein
MRMFRFVLPQSGSPLRLRVERRVHHPERARCAPGLAYLRADQAEQVTNGTIAFARALRA